MSRDLIRFVLLSVFGAVLALPLPSQGQWNSRALAFRENGFGYFPGPRHINTEQRAAIASIWGSGNRYLIAADNLREDRLDIELPRLFRNRVPVFFRSHAQPHQFGRDGLPIVRRAPLLVFVPGVFGEGNSIAGQAIMRRFSRLGYHVLIVPNCWSRQYHLSRPILNSQYPDSEAEVINQAAQWVIDNRLGAENVTSVQIGGESLGAMMAAVAYAKDSRRARPLYTAGATFIYPPISLTAAVNTLDSMISETSDLYARRCGPMFHRLSSKLRVANGSFILSPTPEEIECAPSIIANYGFRQNLFNLATVVTSIIPGLSAPQPDINFQGFVTSFVPRYRSALDRNDRLGLLKTWINDASPTARAKIRILTSEDDFLNRGMSWSELRLSTGLSANQLLIAHWGGHLGLTGLNAYRDFIKAQFEIDR